MNFRLDVQHEEFTNSMRTFLANYKGKAEDAVRKQARLLIKDVIEKTPPRTRSQGVGAVKRDLKRIFFPIKSKHDPALQTSGGLNVVRLFADKAGNVYGVDSELYRPDATLSEMAEHHKKHRDRRGRVTSAGTRTVDVGRWRFVQKMAVPKEVFETYQKRVTARVGQAKAGWSAAYRALGGSPGKWFDRPTIGEFEDKLNTSGFLRAENKSMWATHGDEDRVVHNALNSRARAILESVRIAQEKEIRKAFKK